MDGGNGRAGMNGRLQGLELGSFVGAKKVEQPLFFSFNFFFFVQSHFLAPILV